MSHQPCCCPSYYTGCGDGMAAASPALLDALQHAHLPWDVVSSSAWSSGHHRSGRHAFCFNHTPAILLAHNSIQNAALDFILNFETYTIESTTVECQCASDSICLLIYIIGSIHGTPRTILRIMVWKLSAFRAQVTRQVQDMRFLVEMKQGNTHCSQVLRELVSSLRWNILAQLSCASQKQEWVKQVKNSDEPMVWELFHYWFVVASDTEVLLAQENRWIWFMISWWFW